MTTSSGVHDLVEPVRCESRSREHTSHVNVDRYVTPRQVRDRDTQVSSKDFNRHRGFLLADSVKSHESGGQLGRSWSIRPEQCRVATKSIHNLARCADDPV